LLDVISCLVLRPLPAANVSTAAVFRVAEANRPTFLIDEADTFLAGNEELRGILNSGHRKGASVIRTVGEDHEPRQFATYSACAIALIGKLPATLHDRSAVAELKRRLRSEKVERFRLDRTARLDELARKAARWAEDNAMRIQDCDPKMPDELFNRDADNWRPLLAIADVAGGHWPETARKVAVQCCEAAAAESIGATLEGLLGDIRDLFEEKWVLKYPGFDFLEGNLDLDFSSKEMVEMLIQLEGRPWAELGKQRKPLTQNKLATRLGEIKPPIVPGNVGPENARKRGYKLSQFTDAFARYIVAPAIALQEGEDAPNPQEGGLRVHSRPECDEQGTSGIFKVHSHVLGCALWNREKLNNDGLLCTCAVQKGGTGDSARAGDDRAAPQQDQDGLRRVLAEWRGAFGFDRVVSIDEVVGTEHGGLRDALAPVAAMKDTDTGITLTDGVISNVSLARWLKGVNGVSADRYFLQHEGIDSAGKQLWSLREGAEPPLDELGAPCAGVPLVITRHVRRYLYARGFTDDQIDVLTPEQVHERLSRGLSQEAILELKSWYEAEADRLGLGFDMDALDSALRRRLAGEYGVQENALETEFHRVKYLVSHN
jgi:hypothetical protein